jgi:hypothetical protein
MSNVEELLPKQQIPWSERYSVLQCCGHAVLQSERGKRLETEGKNIKGQSSNAKRENPNVK